MKRSSLFLIFLLLPLGGFSQNFSNPNSNSADESPQRMSPQEAMMARQKQMRQMRERYLNRLKKTNPAQYRLAIKAMARQKKIQALIKKYRSGEIGKEEAIKEMHLLLREDLKAQIRSIPEGIKRLESQKKLIEGQIQTLKQAQKNPEAYIRGEIKQMLNPRPPMPRSWGRAQEAQTEDN